jgi:hypothetical protein
MKHFGTGGRGGNREETLLSLRSPVQTVFRFAAGLVTQSLKRGGFFAPRQIQEETPLPAD